MSTNKTCPVCNQEKPLIEFSTLTRWALDIKQPIGAYCAACYWMQLVTHYPQYYIVDGKASVKYIERIRPLAVYTREMQELLPGRLADKDVRAAFAGLGSLEAQARPFREFVAALSASGRA